MTRLPDRPRHSAPERAWRLATSCAAALAAAVLLACGGGADYGPQGYGLVDCDRYDPVIAKRTFDGRVGRVIVYNDTERPVRLRIYHPDGAGSYPEQEWLLPAGADSLLGEHFGNDWGLQGEQACLSTVGALAHWADGTFTLTWTGDSLHAGPPVSRAEP